MDLPDDQRPMTCPLCGRTGESAPTSPGVPRRSFLVLALLGVVLGSAGVRIATHTIPAFASVQREWGFRLPPETEWVLQSGLIQPIPGCLLLIAGLVGGLRRRSGGILYAFCCLLLLAAVALLALDLVALLIPQLVLV